MDDLARTLLYDAVARSRSRRFDGERANTCNYRGMQYAASSIRPTITAGGPVMRAVCRCRV